MNWGGMRMATDDTITLAQISDLHLGPLPTIPWHLLDLKRLTGTLNWHLQRRWLNTPEQAEAWAADLSAVAADHVAVTGDLCNIGLPVEVERGAQLLRRLGLPARVSVIPGNHDIYSTIDGRKLGAAALAPWSAYMRSDAAGAAYGAGAEPFPFVRVIERGTLRVALIGLNSAVETPPRIATGRLGERQINSLDAALHATGRDGLVRVVMLHHPPLMAWARPHHGLLDGNAFADVLRQRGADLVIHGHNHRAMFNELAGPAGSVPVVGVPSASAVATRGREDLARAHLFEISRAKADDRPTITLISRGLAANGGPIVELGRKQIAG